MGSIGRPETSVATNIRCVTSQKSEDLIETAALRKPEITQVVQVAYFPLGIYRVLPVSHNERRDCAIANA